MKNWEKLYKLIKRTFKLDWHENEQTIIMFEKCYKWKVHEMTENSYKKMQQKTQIITKVLIKAYDF